MNSNGQIKFTNQIDNKPLSLSKRSIYHQAGYAAAIYLLNKEKRLPEIHFQIILHSGRQMGRPVDNSSYAPATCLACLEGGRLIPHLPASFAAATRLLPAERQQECRIAFEADVINLLAGYIAEAKYVALRDNEIFNANLIYLGALKFYGGRDDLKTVDDYMTCLIPGDKTARDKHLAELYLKAFAFVNEASNWFAISHLAEAIYASPKDVFILEELAAYLETCGLAIDSLPGRFFPGSISAVNF